MTIGLARQDLDPIQAAARRAADVFWYLFGWGSWRTLIADLGWSWDEAEQWLAQRGIDALLQQERRRPSALLPVAGRGEHRDR